MHVKWWGKKFWWCLTYSSSCPGWVLTARVSLENITANGTTGPRSGEKYCESTDFHKSRRITKLCTRHSRYSELL